MANEREKTDITSLMRLRATDIKQAVLSVIASSPIRLQGEDINRHNNNSFDRAAFSVFMQRGDDITEDALTEAQDLLDNPALTKQQLTNLTEFFVTGGANTGDVVFHHQYAMISAMQPACLKHPVWLCYYHPKSSVHVPASNNNNNQPEEDVGNNNNGSGSNVKRNKKNTIGNVGAEDLKNASNKTLRGCRIFNVGTRLHEYIPTNPSQQQTLYEQTFTQTASFLMALHSAEIVHRRVHPRNMGTTFFDDGSMIVHLTHLHFNFALRSARFLRSENYTRSGSVKTNGGSGKHMAALEYLPERVPYHAKEYIDFMQPDGPHHLLKKRALPYPNYDHFDCFHPCVVMPIYDYDRDVSFAQLAYNDLFQLAMSVLLLVARLSQMQYTQFLHFVKGGAVGYRAAVDQYRPWSMDCDFLNESIVRDVANMIESVPVREAILYILGQREPISVIAGRAEPEGHDYLGYDYAVQNIMAETTRRGMSAPAPAPAASVVDTGTALLHMMAEVAAAASPVQRRSDDDDNNNAPHAIGLPPAHIRMGDIMPSQPLHAMPADLGPTHSRPPVVLAPMGNNDNIISNNNISNHRISNHGIGNNNISSHSISISSANIDIGGVFNADDFFSSQMMATQVPSGYAPTSAAQAAVDEFAQQPNTNAKIAPSAMQMDDDDDDLDAFVRPPGLAIVSIAPAAVAKHYRPPLAHVCIADLVDNDILCLSEPVMRKEVSDTFGKTHPYQTMAELKGLFNDAYQDALDAADVFPTEEVFDETRTTYFAMARRQKAGMHKYAVLREHGVGDRDTAHVYSVTKSFVGLVAVHHICEGNLDPADTIITNAGLSRVPEDIYMNNGATRKLFETVTLGHLLTQSSGIKTKSFGVESALDLVGMFTGAILGATFETMIGRSIEGPFSDTTKPGDVFWYDNLLTQTGAIAIEDTLRARLGPTFSIREEASALFIEPVIRSCPSNKATWFEQKSADTQGRYTAGLAGLQMTGHTLMDVGILLLNTYKPLLEFIRGDSECKGKVNTNIVTLGEEVMGGDGGPPRRTKRKQDIRSGWRYSFLWWLPDIPNRRFMACIGYQGQYLLLELNTETVFVRQHYSTTPFSVQFLDPFSNNDFPDFITQCAITLDKYDAAEKEFVDRVTKTWQSAPLPTYEQSKQQQQQERKNPSKKE